MAFTPDKSAKPVVVRRWVKATVSCPPSATVFGPSDLRTTPAGLSAASRRTASRLLVITVGAVANPQRAAVASCSGL